MTPTPAPQDRLAMINQLRDIVAQLRAPGGCPWDREQTHRSLRPSLMEEAYEVVAAINNADDVNLREELGDLLLQVVFHAQIAQEEGRFNFDSVAEGISEKLIRRHPHVFGEEKCANSAEVLTRWDDIKRAEKAALESQNPLPPLPPQNQNQNPQNPGGLPALLRAEKVQKKAARVGFDWSDAAPVFVKLREEIAEVEAELFTNPERLEDEIGDLLFTVVNLARKLKIDGEIALHRATDKFVGRFEKVEQLARERGITLNQSTLAELDLLWDEVKRLPAKL